MFNVEAGMFCYVGRYCINIYSGLDKYKLPVECSDFYIIMNFNTFYIN